MSPTFLQSRAVFPRCLMGLFIYYKQSIGGDVCALRRAGHGLTPPSSSRGTFGGSCVTSADLFWLSRLLTTPWAQGVQALVVCFEGCCSVFVDGSGPDQSSSRRQRAIAVSCLALYRLHVVRGLFGQSRVFSSVAELMISWRSFPYDGYILDPRWISHRIG